MFSGDLQELETKLGMLSWTTGPFPDFSYSFLLFFLKFCPPYMRSCRLFSGPSQYWVEYRRRRDQAEQAGHLSPQWLWRPSVLSLHINW